MANLQEILPVCQEFGVLDGTAFLLERLGDIPAALDIYVQQVSPAMGSWSHWNHQKLKFMSRRVGVGQVQFQNEMEL